MKRLLAGLLLCLMAALACAADGRVALPTLKARVTDLTGTLDAGQRQTIEDRLAALDAQKGSQIAVLLLPSTKPETIEQFGIRVAETWKIGRKGVDDGVVVIVAKDDHRMRIEVGYGLEGALNDATAKRIISESMTPRFKQNDYFGGLQDGLNAIIAVIEGEELPAPKSQNVPAESDDSWMTWVLMIIVFASPVRQLLGILGSVIAAALAGYFVFGAFGLWLAPLAAAAITFIFSFIPISSILGGGGGGSSSSSFGGGFSGGGGSFGGGGASGGW